MKSLVIVVFLFCFQNVIAQTHSWYFTDVIGLDSTITKEVLFRKSRQWFSTTFVSGKNVIDNADPDEGVIYGRGSFELAAGDGSIDFNIELRCKDGKLKYTLSNFNHKGAYPVNIFGSHIMDGSYGGGSHDFGPLNQTEKLGAIKLGGRSNARWEEIKEDAHNRTVSLIMNLRNSMTPEKLKAADDW